MNKPSFVPRVLIAAGLLCASAGVWAFGDEAPGVYVEAGQARHALGDTTAAAIGAMLPWAPGAGGHGGAISFAFDLFGSQWRAPDESPHRNYTQLGIIATWRYRFDEGRSPWFADAGIGATVTNQIYRTTDREFSTAFQFTEVLALGRSFGERGEHELSVRLQHFSNGGIKKPNPGENFVRLRYLYRF